MRFWIALSLICGHMAFAEDVPIGCPIHDAALIQAVQDGHRITCQIHYYAGRSGWTWQPVRPTPMPTIAEACIDSENRACAGNAACATSPYFQCHAE